MEVVIEYDHPQGHPIQITLDNGEVWIVQGTCKRCGECCKALNCHLVKPETINGIEVTTCTTYWNRFLKCVLYPIDPKEDIYPPCGYNWKRIK